MTKRQIGELGPWSDTFLVDEDEDEESILTAIGGGFTAGGTPFRRVGGYLQLLHGVTVVEEFPSLSGTSKRLVQTSAEALYVFAPEEEGSEWDASW